MKKNNFFKKLILAAMLLSTFTGTLISQSWNQIGNDINGEAAGDYSGFAVSLNSDGNLVAIGAWRNDNVSGSDAGHVRVFQNISDSWVQIGNDIDGEAAGDYFGRSVCINVDGSIVAIGATYNDGNGSSSGHVRIYEYQSGAWIQVGNDINGEASWDYSGNSISLNSDGSIVAISAPYNDENGSNAGHVRIYQNMSGSWVQIGSDINGEAEGDESGVSVSLNNSGSIVAIGAYKNDGAGEDAGHVRVFELQSGSWIQKGNDIDGEAADDFFGRAVSLNADGSIVVVGAHKNDGNGEEAGHVRVFEYQAGSWIQKGNDIDGETTQDWFGIAVSINDDGSTIAVGASQNNGIGLNLGYAKIYNFHSGSWNQTGGNLDGEASGDGFGRSISLNSDGSKVAVGAWGNDDNGSNAGHTRVFDFGLATSILTEDVYTKWLASGTMFIYDITGQFVDQMEINGPVFNLELDNTGVYILVVRDGSSVFTKKVIVK